MKHMASTLSPGGNRRPWRVTIPLVVALAFGLLIPRFGYAQGTGEFLCNGGTRSGLACESDPDCVPNGVCVIAAGVCDGGSDDGLACECLGGSCLTQPLCSVDATMGTCSGGILAGECCDSSFNCASNRPCAGSAKICLGGEDKAFACLRDSQCRLSQCTTTGKFCSGICANGQARGTLCLDDADCPGSTCTSDFQNYACGDDSDCCTIPPCTAGICRGPAATCIGDCDGGGSVTIAELVTVVNIALATAQISACAVGDADNDGHITVDELVRAVNNALYGCGLAPPASARTAAVPARRRSSSHLVSLR